MGLTLEGNKKLPIHVVPEVAAADIASGSDHLVILARNGKVYSIGCAEQGQLGRVTARSLTGESRRGNKVSLTPGCIPKKAGTFTANAIWATPFCTFLREHKTDLIYGFGLNNFNQLGVKKGGKEFEHLPVLSKFANVKAIAGGQHHTIVLTNDNQVYAIGRKDYGRLGLGEVDQDVEELTHVSTLADVSDITCGESNSFAITKDGNVHVWGMGTNSQLGTGDEDDVDVPKHLISAQLKDKNVLSVSSGGQHSMFLVEVPESTVKPAKTDTVVLHMVTPMETDSEAAPKENGNTAKATAAGGTKRKLAEAPVVMESDSTTDVNGNSKKDDKVVVDSTTVKRARKRKT